MYLVIDVGGTYVKYAVMDKHANISKKGKTPAPTRLQHTIDDFYKIVTDMYNEVKSEYDIEGIAMSLPGMIDVENGIVYGGGALTYLDKCHLGKVLSEKCDNVPVVLENDAKCAALAEAYVGNAKEYDDAALVILGTGVGGALVKDKKIHRGKHLSAGEFSYFISEMTREDLEHNVINAEGRKVTVEEYLDRVHYIASSKISAAALCNQVAHLKNMNYVDVSGEQIYKWIDEGDEEVKDIVEEFYFNIAKMCCNLHVMYDPEVILLGGGISAAPGFIEGVLRYAKVISPLTNMLGNLNIKPCKFLNDSNLIGALYNFRQMIEGR